MRRLLLSLVALSPISIAPLAASTVVFSNLGPFGRGWAVGEPASPCHCYQAFAVPFQPSITDHLASLVLPLVFVGGTDLFTINIANDSAGAPGPVIESFTTDSLPTPTFELVTFTSILHPLLSAGSTYWIEVLPASSTSDGGWADSLTYLGVDIRRLSGIWVSIPTIGTPLLEVTGVAAATTSEPPVGLMMLAGLGVLFCTCAHRWPKKGLFAR